MTQAPTDDRTKSSQPIIIKVKTAYLDDHSQPDKKRFAFAYTITIENNFTIHLNISLLYG